MEPGEISPFHVSMSTALQVLLRQPYCWDIIDEASLSFLGSTTSEQTTKSSDSYAHPILPSVVFSEKAGPIKPIDLLLTLLLSLHLCHVTKTVRVWEH